MNEERYPSLSAEALPLPRTFSTRLLGAYRYLALLMLLGGACPLGLVIVLLRAAIHRSFSASAFSLLVFFGSLVLVAFLLLCSVFFLRGYSLLSHAKFLLIPEGIVYDGVSLKLYTPWKNIAGIDYGRKHRLRGLILCEPAVIDVSVKEGIRQEIAVIELTRYTLMKRHFKEMWKLPHLFLIDYGIVGRDWLAGEFGAYLRHYAPQLCEREKPA